MLKLNDELYLTYSFVPSFFTLSFFISKLFSSQDGIFLVMQILICHSKLLHNYTYLLKTNKNSAGALVATTCMALELVKYFAGQIVIYVNL